MPVVTLLDTLRIQNFVFATNRLRDAVGGSQLVERLSAWARDVCPIEDVLLAAGGNAQLRFADEPRARAALARLSRQAHDEAPGLEFAAVHVNYSPGGLAAAILQGQRELQQAKVERLPSVPLLGLGVTAACRETRLPATALDVEGQPLAAGIAARRKAALRDHGADLVSADATRFGKRLRFPSELDDLGRSRDDRSLIGVVHVDGNGVGRKIADWLQGEAAASRGDEPFLADYRRISDGLTRLAGQALQAVVDRVVAAISADSAGGYQITSRRLGRGFALSSDAETLNLPLRPLIFGGDDLTFVGDGRLALDLAATALGVFEQSDVPILGRVNACAGVAIMPVHAPILRTYELAADLCDEAKKLIRSSSKEGSALDWHIGFASSSASLEQVRQRQYRAGPRRLTCRPYRLGARGEIGTWRWLADDVLGADGFHGPAWRQRRTKIAALRDLLRDGPEAVKRGLEAWRLAAPELRLPAGLEETGGYLGEATPLLDAIELLDIHFPLEGPS